MVKTARNVGDISTTESDEDYLGLEMDVDQDEVEPRAPKISKRRKDRGKLNHQIEKKLVQLGGYDSDIEYMEVAMEVVMAPVADHGKKRKALIDVAP